MFSAPEGPTSAIFPGRYPDVYIMQHIVIIIVTKGNIVVFYFSSNVSQRQRSRFIRNIRCIENIYKTPEAGKSLELSVKLIKTSRG